MDMLSFRPEALKIAAMTTMEPKTPDRVMEAAERFMDLIESGHRPARVERPKRDGMDEK